MLLMSVDTQSLSLLIFPSPILLQRASEVDASDRNVQEVARRMIEMMFEQNGVGLAAPQVGLSWRLFVTRNPEDKESGVAWMNPTLEVTSTDDDIEEEGCLSLPKIRGDVRRPTGIQISGFDVNGDPAQESSDEFIARVWQHENDHLDGILIINKMSSMDRLINRRLIRNLERAV
jgi:peptide deformylase